MTSTPSDLPEASAVDPDRLDDRHRHRAPALADFLRVGVEPHIGIRRAVERSRPKGVDDRIELGDNVPCDS
jgi:hypothetical protein